jgi:hypothetical protein
MKMAVFWDAATCSLVKFTGVYLPDDGGSKYL